MQRLETKNIILFYLIYSFNRLSVKNNSSQTNLQLFNLNGRQYETKIPKATSSRYNCHAYDTVPLDKLECLKLLPSVQMLSKSSEVNSESSNLAFIKSSDNVPTTISSLHGDQKLHSHTSEYNTEQNQTQVIESNILQDTRHPVDMLITSSSETEVSVVTHKKLIKYESNRTLEISNLQLNPQSFSKNCSNISNSRKSVEIPKASVQPIRQKPVKVRKQKLQYHFTSYVSTTFQRIGIGMVISQLFGKPK